MPRTPKAGVTGGRPGRQELDDDFCLVQEGMTERELEGIEVLGRSDCSREYLVGLGTNDEA